MQKYIFIISSILCLIGCKNTQVVFNKRVVSNTQFKEQFYITKEEPRAKSNRMYYWFKSQKVHNSQSDYSGELIDGGYTKYYYSNQLAEKGEFSKGLKVYDWNTWHPNGKLASTEHWRNGHLVGKSIIFDSIGEIISKGKYKNGKRSGKWIYPKKGDTIYYKKGIERVVKIRDTTKVSFFKRFFKKKESIEAVKNQKKDIGFFKKIFSKKGNKVKESDKKKPKVKPKKEKKSVSKTNFFTRLFAKKDTKK